MGPGTPREGPPTAKRPRQREDASASAPASATSLQQLTDCFNELGSKCAVDSAQIISTASAVAWNADLLNTVMAQVRKLEVQIPVMVMKSDQFDAYSTEIAAGLQRAIGRFDVVVPQVEACFDLVREKDKADDRALREELNNVMAKLDKGLEEMRARLGVVERASERVNASAASASATPQATSPEPVMHEMQRQVDAFAGMARQASEQVIEFSKGMVVIDNRAAILESGVGG